MKTVKNIKKITSAMKLVAASKLRKAQVDMEKSRQMVAPFVRIVGDHPATEGRKNLTVPLTSDRGLCGGINSSVARFSRATFAAAGGEDASYVVLGEKGRAQLQRSEGSRITQTIGDLAKVRWGGGPRGSAWVLACPPCRRIVVGPIRLGVPRSTGATDVHDGEPGGGGADEA